MLGKHSKKLKITSRFNFFLCSPNIPRVYIREQRHGKCVLLLKYKSQILPPCIDPFHVCGNAAKLEEKTKTIFASVKQSCSAFPQTWKGSICMRKPLTWAVQFDRGQRKLLCNLCVLDLCGIINLGRKYQDIFKVFSKQTGTGFLKAKWQLYPAILPCHSSPPSS